MAGFVDRVSGMDRSTWVKGRVGGTDLGIPFLGENGQFVSYLFGDSFSNQSANGPDWRSPVAFRSTVNPTNATIVFDSAYKTPANANGNILAPEIFYNAHQNGAYTNGEFNPFGTEFTCIPNDGISFSATGDQLVSFMSINRWRNANGSNAVGPNWAGNWRTNFNAFAISHNGNDFSRPAHDANYTAIWYNNEQNTDPFQMMTTADGYDGWVYVYSVRSGRQSTPMMLQKVPWNQMFNMNAYQGWYRNASGVWGWGGPNQCTSLFPEKMMGEPSVRRLGQGWAMSYLTPGSIFQGFAPNIVTRTAPSPTGPWSAEKVQVTTAQEGNLYGGFIHPWSDYGTNKLTIMVSKWVFNTPTYDTRQYRGTL